VVARLYRHLVDAGVVDNPRPVDPSELCFESIWIVSQRAGDFNPAHKHAGDFSGVIYLRLPAGLEAEWAREDHYPSAGYIEFIDGRPNDYVRSRYRLRPCVGMILLFPSWLLHLAYPFRCPGERRSLSFNVVLPRPAHDR
jgi:Putative 2OG-Fe(II) oxygenase